MQQMIMVLLPNGKLYPTDGIYNTIEEAKECLDQKKKEGTKGRFIIVPYFSTL